MVQSADRAAASSAHRKKQRASPRSPMGMAPLLLPQSRCHYNFAAARCHEGPSFTKNSLERSDLFITDVEMCEYGHDIDKASCCQNGWLRFISCVHNISPYRRYLTEKRYSGRDTTTQQKVRLNCSETRQWIDKLIRNPKDAKPSFTPLRQLNVPPLLSHACCCGGLHAASTLGIVSQRTRHTACTALDCSEYAMPEEKPTHKR